MDELAKKANQDPLAFRLAHLQKAPRFQAALKLAADKSAGRQAAGARRPWCLRFRGVHQLPGHRHRGRSR